MSEEQVHEDIISADNPISEEQVSEEKIEKSEVQEESTIPEKFRGKSMEDLVEMYTNLEQEKSRLGNDLGETRKIVDKLLQAEAFTSKPQETEEAIDWDYEPEKAAEKLIESKVGAVEKKLNEIERQSEIERFKGRFPDFEKDSASSDFLEWVAKSDYRTRLYEKNHTGVDLAAATELMQGWEDHKANNAARATNRDKAMKDAAMESGASTASSRKKVWSRAYIRDLMKNDPKTYRKHYDEIMAAYRENRLTK